MQYRENADLCSKMPGIGGNFLQGLRHGTEQHAIADPLVLQRKRRKLLRDSKHDMAVKNGKQLLRPFSQPLIPRDGLTLGTISIAAGVVSDHATATMITLLHVAAQSGSAAGADVPERFPLLR